MANCTTGHRHNYNILCVRECLSSGHHQKPIVVGASMGGITAMFCAHEVARACVFVDIGAKVEVSGSLTLWLVFPSYGWSFLHIPIVAMASAPGPTVSHVPRPDAGT